MMRSLRRAPAAKLFGALCFLGAAGFAFAADAAKAPDVEWRGYNNGYDSQRYSPLAQITPANVASLQPVCGIKLGDDGAFESGLVMIGATLYVTTAHTTVALDPTNCAQRWRHVYVPEESEGLVVNRGVAYLDGRLFRGTADGRILAIDAKTGKELWRTRAADPTKSEEFTAAPIAWDGLVFLGPAGGDFGIRGRVAAFDAKTGREVWRFDTIPEGNEAGADTWKIPATVKHGGGGTWTSYTLDPATGELFVPVGNPAPDYAAGTRPGTNLYTNAVVVLDAATGKLKWFYQLDPNDGFDWDLGAAPMLYQDGRGQNRVALGSKDGHVYVLDRQTHKLLFKTEVTTVSVGDAKPTLKGTRVCPGALGGVEWNGPAYAPPLNMIYVGAVDWCFVESGGNLPDWKMGEFYVGTGAVPTAGAPKSGWITAIDGHTGAVKWRYHSPTPIVAGITPTGGGLVFAGNLGGDFLVFDATSGKLLLNKPSGDAFAGGIVSYQVAGKQYVAATTGNVSRITFGNGGTPKVVIMTTGLPVNYQAADLIVKQPEGEASNTGPARGKSLFAQFCAACHGMHGEGGLTSGPNIQNSPLIKNRAALVAWIKNPKSPMPKLFPSPLSESDVDAVAGYVMSLKAR
jgi:alcohol dehydrogenase (cytochrome c)